MNVETSDPKQLFSVADKTVVITGGFGLLGSTLSRSFHKGGSRVIILDTQAMIESGPSSELSEAMNLACDVSCSESIADCYNKIISRHQTVDVLINCHQFKPQGFLEAQAESFPDDLWNDIINVNLSGTFKMCRQFGKKMIEQGYGSIINLASTYGVVSSNPALYDNNSMGNPVAYSASKGGVIMLTKYLGAYWAEKGVRVNCLTPHGIYNKHEPTFVDRFSAMSPMKRMCEPQELIGAAIYLASDASSYVTGSNLLVEGGWTAW